MNFPPVYGDAFLDGLTRGLEVLLLRGEGMMGLGVLGIFSWGIGFNARGSELCLALDQGTVPQSLKPELNAKRCSKPEHRRYQM